jgi:hypothetical protein
VSYDACPTAIGKQLPTSCLVDREGIGGWVQK